MLFESSSQHKTVKNLFLCISEEQASYRTHFVVNSLKTMRTTDACHLVTDLLTELVCRSYLRAKARGGEEGLLSSSHDRFTRLSFPGTKRTFSSYLCQDTARLVGRCRTAGGAMSGLGYREKLFADEAVVFLGCFFF